MPQALGMLVIEAAVAASGVGSFGTAITVFGFSAATAATFIGTAIILGATVGAQLLLRDTADEPLDKPELTIRQPLPARFIPLGQVRIGGAIFLYERSNVNGQNLMVGKVIACCPIQAVDQVFFNGELNGLSSGFEHQNRVSVTTGPAKNFINMDTSWGIPGQAASPLLLEQTDIGWSSLYTLQGLSYVAVRFTAGNSINDHQGKYPSGAPDTAWVIRGAKCPDPRVATLVDGDQSNWIYSENAAICILRYLLDGDGWGHKVADYDLNSFIEAAQWCDETQVAGDVRYRICGVYYTTDERSSTLQDLLAACDGRLIEQANGKAKLYVGRFVVPTITIVTSQILEISLERFGDPMQRVDQVKARITDPSNNWQETDVAPVTADVLDPEQAPKVMDLPLRFCPTHTQATRLAKAALRRANATYVGRLVTTLAGLQAFGERFILVQYPALGIDSAFEVESFSLDVRTMTVAMDIRSIEADRWD